MKLLVKKDYILSKFYRFDTEDTFDYFYYRNNRVFSKNKFYKQYDEFKNGYDNEKYDKEKNILSDADIIRDECFIIPKGIYELNIIKHKRLGTMWELNINGVIITGLRDLLSINNEIKEFMEVVKD